MPRPALVFAKASVHLACLLPLGWLAWAFPHGTLGVDSTLAASRFTGVGALRLLVLTLAITPARRLWPPLAPLLRFRRLLGLYAFFYATVHLLLYLQLNAGWRLRAIVDDLRQERYLWAGLAAFLLLLPLAATSGPWAMRRLGSRWRTLHRLVYPAAFVALVHAWWSLKAGQAPPVALTLAVFALLGVRPLLALWSRTKKKPPPGPRTAAFR